jgi:hypothetical protein
MNSVTTTKGRVRVRGNVRVNVQDRSSRHYFDRAATEPPDGEMDEKLDANSKDISK